MKITQESERTYTVVLSDVELDDLTAESKNRDFTPLEIMKAVFFSVFVQIVSCSWRRAILSPLDNRMIKAVENGLDKQEPDGG